MAFRSGDAVQLKAGGPKMTIESIDVVAGAANCAWFVGGDLRRDRLTLDSIQSYVEKAPVSVRSGPSFRRHWMSG